MSSCTLNCQSGRTARGLHFAADDSRADAATGPWTAALHEHARKEEQNTMDVVHEVDRERILADDELALLAHGIVQDLQAARRDLRHVSLDEVKRRIARAGRQLRDSVD